MTAEDEMRASQAQDLAEDAALDNDAFDALIAGITTSRYYPLMSEAERDGLASAIVEALHAAGIDFCREPT